MKNLIKKAGKQSLATMVLALSSAAVFAGTSNASDNSSGGAVVLGFAVLIGALIVPALGHKAHH